MRRWLLLLFLATIAIDWPHLPFNARATDAVFVIVAVAILAKAKWSRPRFTALDLAVAGYIAGSAISVLLSPDPRSGAIELVRQSYLVVISIVIVLAVRQGLATTVATGLASSGAVLAAVGVGALIIQAVFGVGTDRIGPVTTLPYLGPTLRLTALTMSPAMFACVLAASVPFVMLHPEIAASRARSWVAGFVMAIATAMTFSHSVAGVAVSAVTAAWQRLRGRSVRLAAVAAAAAIVIGFNFAATVSIRSIGDARIRDNTIYQYAVDGGRARIAGVNVEYEIMSYFRIKQVAWDAFTSRPLTGIGLDRFHEITEAAFQQGRLTERYRLIDPHSTLMGRLAEAGLIGAVTLIVFWIVIAREARRLLAQPHEHAWMATAAAAALLGTLVNTMNADVMNFRFAWVVLGLVRGLPRRSVRAKAGLREIQPLRTFD
jgi:O-antigen ligase